MYQYEKENVEFVIEKYKKLIKDEDINIKSSEKTIKNNNAEINAISNAATLEAENKYFEQCLKEDKEENEKIVKEIKERRKLIVSYKNILEQAKRINL